jgi:hypothetical protein
MEYCVASQWVKADEGERAVLRALLARKEKISIQVLELGDG